MGHISTLILHYRKRSISQLSLVSLDVFCQQVPITFVFSIFLEISSRQFAKMNIKRQYPYHSTTHKMHSQQLQHKSSQRHRQHFECFSQLPSYIYLRYSMIAELSRIRHSLKVVFKLRRKWECQEFSIFLLSSLKKGIYLSLLNWDRLFLV